MYAIRSYYDSGEALPALGGADIFPDRTEVARNILGLVAAEAHVDAGKLEQVMINLLNNALKHTPEA